MHAQDSTPDASGLDTEKAPAAGRTLPPDSVGIVAPQRIAISHSLPLDCGRSLDGFELMVETYGELNAAHSNAVLVCHALSSDHHAAGWHSLNDRKPGWWDAYIGPGKPIDTNRFFVVALNNLGGCNGSTGPSSINPATGQPWGPDFPLVTVRDWVRSQSLLADTLGIQRWAAVIGGSLGGMQAMQWPIDYPERVAHSIIIATAPRLTAQNIAFNEIARQAILSDPDYHGGRYYAHGINPARGLKLARMLGHITYLSNDAMRARFGRMLRDNPSGQYAFNYENVEFEVESYLRHQGQTFIDHFDANTYLLMTKALDYFDPAADFHDDLAAAFKHTQAPEQTSPHTKFLVISFSSDWRFSPTRSHEIVQAMVRARCHVNYAEVTSDAGHDGFLMPLPEYQRALGSYLQRVADELGTPQPAPAATARSSAPEAQAPDGDDGDDALRPDLSLICNWIKPGSRILDLGCGNGHLLRRLSEIGQVGGYGLEIDPDNVNACIASGIDVIQADLNAGLAGFDTDSFDIVVMTQAIQALKHPDHVLAEMLRVGREAIITFPNFGHWRARLALSAGHMPITPALPHRWFDSPNIRLCTVRDFETLCAERGWRVLQRAALNESRHEELLIGLFPNLLCEVGLYQLGRSSARP
ncbi:MAG: homoserine O-acetyltransferase [Sinobacteraceae bacterium]|nr:homoserine O-acetyltransferase [Nevskiaceae bacterium]